MPVKSSSSRLVELCIGKPMIKVILQQNSLSAEDLIKSFAEKVVRVDTADFLAPVINAWCEQFSNPYHVRDASDDYELCDQVIFT